MSGLDCESCGCKVHLEYRNKIVKLASGKRIGFANAPILVCGGCGARYVPYMTNTLIAEIRELEEETESEPDTASVSNIENMDQNGQLTLEDINYAAEAVPS